MIKTKADWINKIHLIISVCIVVPVAILYGFKPHSNFEIYPKTIDEYNMLKAIMGIYIGFSSLWILGIFKHNYLKTALITNIIFMLGLAIGRLISLAIDGVPTFAYVFGTFAELFLGIYGFWVLSNLKKTNG